MSRKRFLKNDAKLTSFSLDGVSVFPEVAPNFICIMGNVGISHTASSSTQQKVVQNVIIYYKRSFG